MEDIKKMTEQAAEVETEAAAVAENAEAQTRNCKPCRQEVEKSRARITQQFQKPWR
jgi:hypothetical protein